MRRRAETHLIDEQRERVGRLLRGGGEEEAVGREAQREAAARAGRERDEQTVGHAARLARQARPVHRVVLREQLLRARCARAATRALQDNSGIVNAYFNERLIELKEQ